MVRKQREKKIPNGQKGIRVLKTRVGRECRISRRDARLYSGDIRAGEVRGGSHSVTRGNGAGEQLQE